MPAFIVRKLSFKNFKSFSIFLGLILVLGGVLLPNIINAQQAALTPAQQKALQDELTQVEQQIKDQQVILDQKKQEGSSISRDIAILDAQIKQAQLKIKAHDIAIASLGKDIVVKKNTITALSSQIDRQKADLAQIIEKTQELDNYSLVEALLSNRNLGQFFIDADTFININQALKDKVNQITDSKQKTEIAKEQLDQERNKEIDLKVNVVEEKNKIQKGEADKKKLLALNKNDQKAYQNSIADKQKRAAQIRNALFALRDSASIKFGDAVQYAKIAAGAAGIRPAFLLAIIQQESNLGANVGACKLTDTTTGAGIRVKTGVAVSNLMKPSRDIAPFLKITSEVGRDPLQQVVSCPFSVGYGGAMGPAQFIPSTWMLFRDRIASALGISTPDPWKPADAFTASALYLSDLGANQQGYTAERNAACKYYSGKSCSGSNTFYGDQVMAKATTLQGNIDILQAN